MTTIVLELTTEDWFWGKVEPINKNGGGGIKKKKDEKLGPMNLPSRITDKDDPGMFKLNLYIFEKTGNKYYTMEKGEVGDDSVVRIDSKCVYAHILGSARCDCAEQLHLAIKFINSERKGLLIYAYDQDGRGISLRDHLRVYKLQDEGYDTVDANIKTGLKPDCRNYNEVVEILKDYGLKKIKLLTNNPQRIKDLTNAGIIVERKPFKAVELDKYNAAQLIVKQTKLGHLFEWDLEDPKTKDLFDKSMKQQW